MGKKWIPSYLRPKTLQEKLSAAYGEGVATGVPEGEVDELVERLRKTVEQTHEVKVKALWNPNPRQKSRWSRVPGTPLRTESRSQRRARLRIEVGKPKRHYNTKRKQSRNTTRKYRSLGKDKDKLRREASKNNKELYYYHLKRCYGSRFLVTEAYWLGTIVPLLVEELSSYSFYRPDKKLPYSDSNLEVRLRPSRPCSGQMTA